MGLEYVGRLTRLRSLVLHSGIFSSELLRTLTSLRSLRHLHIRDCRGYRAGMGRMDRLTLLDVCPIFHMSQLTSLEILNVRHDGRDLDSAASEAMVRAIEPLAACQQLRRLSFGPVFTVYDHMFAALVNCTNLSQLSVGSIVSHLPAPSVPCGAGEHLPALQHLTHGHLTASVLLQSLQRLSLSRLTRMVSDLPWLGGSCVDFLSWCLGDTREQSVEIAAMRTASVLLATAPLLKLKSVQLRSVGRLGDLSIQIHFSPESIAWSLQPFRESLLNLSFMDFCLWGGEWAVLGAAFPQLQRLRLVHSKLTESALGSVVPNCPALVSLTLRGCSGVTLEGWLNLCSRPRAHALCVELFWPHHGDGQLQQLVHSAYALRCAALQDHLFGVQNITFQF